MCAIIGAVIARVHTAEQRNKVNRILAHIWDESHQRGRDGRGYLLRRIDVDDIYKSTDRLDEEYRDNATHYPGCPKLIPMHTKHATVIANLRAEPTTEFVADKFFDDQQPYTCGDWTIVHNGTIANDKELRINPDWGVPTTIDSAAIAEHLSQTDRHAYRFGHFKMCVQDLKGSFAILASHKDEPGNLYVACNYRPIWYVTTDVGTFFASARDYFPDGMSPQMIRPYSVMRFSAEEGQIGAPLYDTIPGKRTALVVCSGGLDSVVAATYMQKVLHMDLHLLHFQYGSRAEGPEVQAVKDVAQFLGAKLTLFPLPIYDKSCSPLLRDDAEVAGGEAGAEFAHEWVPARNLVLLSVATAFAESNGIEYIVLGNNLEEAGAYPDNEPEFVSRFNDLLPFAVGDGKRMRVVMPVGNMMKHEIVALGHRIGAPIHLTWSCYRAGKLHCGKCGPCFMRRKAFEINKIKEVVDYVPVN